ncbi:IS91 family transposase, partial [Chryseomicrobium imtechense]
HYGMYARNRKAKVKALLTKWQKEVKKWFVKAGAKLRKRNWREKFLMNNQPDPLVCPKCENHLVFKGEVCLDDGVLTIRVAVCNNTKKYLERVIDYLTSQQDSKEKEKGQFA